MFFTVADHPVSAAWAHHSWTRLGGWPRKQETLVLVPLHGTADWGLGLSLDVEEVIGSAVLKAAVAEAGMDERLLLAPPLRFFSPPGPGGAFGLDFETAYALAESVLGGIREAGFCKAVLFNTGPLNEAFTDILGRDMRIRHSLQMFCVNLSGLGLDPHPERGQGAAREAVRALAVHLLRQPAEATAALPALSVDDADASAPRLLTAAGAQLARLLGEISRWPSLPDQGRISLQRPGENDAC